MNPIRQASEAIRQASRVLVAAHTSPDIDAAGSLLALGLALDRIGVERVLYLEDGTPHEARALPIAGQITRQTSGPFDLVVTLDCPVFARIGTIHERLAGVPVVNLDHHISNTNFGTVNLVATQLASTAQLVQRLIAALGVSVDVPMATCLLAGLVGDTQGFRTPNTSRREVRDADALMAIGADLFQVCQWIFGTRPRGHLHFWGHVLSSAAVKDGIVWSAVTLAARKKAGVPENDGAGVVNFLISIDGVRAAALFSERRDGTVDVNLRSLPGVDVAAVAADFGGGGHRQAAGCTVTGTLADVERRVLARLRQAVDEAALRRPATG
ncbi:MAG: DHH family phosphoesterase [Anaerolineae bacterium]